MAACDGALGSIHSAALPAQGVIGPRVGHIPPRRTRLVPDMAQVARPAGSEGGLHFQREGRLNNTLRIIRCILRNIIV
eukprot:5754854-Pyramimonas_sp.AAC.1